MLNYNQSVIFGDFVIHFNANVIQHVNDLLIIMFSLFLFGINSICNLSESFSIFSNLFESHETVKPVLGLSLDLLPLELIILEYGLYLFDDPLLVALNASLLDPEGALDILEEVFGRLYLPLTLPLPLADRVPHQLLLSVQLRFQGLQVPVQARDRLGQRVELSGDTRT